MNNLSINIFQVSKKTLLLVAGLVWLFAGFRVFTLGSGDVISNKGNIAIALTIAVIVFFLFFRFIFSKMHKKHAERIINYTQEKKSIFAFFDKKAYIIMGCMIFFGIGVRSLHIFNPVYLGSFYIGLGGALFSAGVLFLISWFDFENTKLKYSSIKRCEGSF